MLEKGRCNAADSFLLNHMNRLIVGSKTSPSEEGTRPRLGAHLGIRLTESDPSLPREQEVFWNALG